MRINELLFLLIGLLISLLITYIYIISKFNKFINNELEQNKIYRSNAEIDHFIASGNNPDALNSSIEGGTFNEK